MGESLGGGWALEVTKADGTTVRAPLTRSPFVVGRGQDCDLILEGMGSSRRHVEFRLEAGSVYARDLDSSAGTYLNHQRMGGLSMLAPGDRVGVGPTVLRLVRDVSPAAAPTAAPTATPERPSVVTGDVARDRRHVDLLLEAIAALHRTDDLDELLRLVVDRAVTLAGGTRGALLLKNTEGALEEVVARDAAGQDLEPGVALTRSVPARALEEGRAVVLTDAAAPEQKDEASPSIVASALRTVLAVPLPTPRGPIGVLYVDGRRPAELGPAELAVLEALAAQGAAAIERGRLAEARAARAAATRTKLEGENARLRAELTRDELLGDGPAMTRALDLARRVAPSELAVLIQGETGSGKELLARRLHRASARRDGPFVVVDCGAIPQGLVESELFGHEKGAFTGAVASRRGRLREAEGGTLFLDEVGELPLELQPKLLRALQERTVTPVGGGGPVTVDLRVVAATHRDLAAMVAAGTFRQDLFYRLSAVTLELPPLRERGDDVELLARAFLVRHTLATGREDLRGFTREALDALRAHAWPGNVRELEHTIHRAVVLAEPPWVTRLDLDLPATGDATPVEAAPPAPLLEADRPLPSLQDARAAATERFERAYVTECLRRAGGNVSHAADLALVSRQLFQRLLKRHGIDRAGFVDEGPVAR